MQLNELESRSRNVADFLKIVAHPDRLVALCQLTEGEKAVNELAEHTSLSQSAFSQHLRVLRESGIIRDRKASTHVYYSLADERVEALLHALKESFCDPEEL